MRGFFSIEILLILFLLPFFTYLFESYRLPLVRETEVLTQDAAQLLMNGHSIYDFPTNNLVVWLDDVSTGTCTYQFKYCTQRYFEGGEHTICLAECLH
ncbi:MAG: hypothetical protein GOV01_02215 [Candidatus Altiarchaeota archaeon]|nr:hypothetical protein [Candidatus Altiarchaeota archaeon]